ncbi:hypothetical protein BDR26DRAFT_970014 [Obelidium mucronatum]|nr:hypothetical protein BDR26DRAFT_970014 [Obelidium mucronatum]
MIAGTQWNVLVMGNPRIGKSSFLNALLRKNGGKAIFEAGLSFGSGLTTELQKVECNNITYVDTPGLADPMFAEKAAREIEKALRLGGIFKLIFFVKQLNGMVACEDVTTINAILGAIKERVWFGVVVNQIPPVVFSELNNNSVSKFAMECQIVEGLSHSSPHKISGIHFEPLVEVTSGSWMPSESLFNFFARQAECKINPEMVGSVAVPGDVDAAEIQTTINQVMTTFSNEIRLLKQENAEILQQLQSGHVLMEEMRKQYLEERHIRSNVDSDQSNNGGFLSFGDLLRNMFYQIAGPILGNCCVM